MSATAQMEFTGRLLDHAHARMKQIDAQGHMAPVLCLVIELDGELHTRMDVEQPFRHGDIEQARAAASRHKPGERVTVQVPVDGIRMTAHNAAHIHVIKEQE